MEIGRTHAITQKPSGRTDHDGEELREPLWAPKYRRHGVGPRATSDDIPTGPNLLDGRVRHDSVSLQPQSTLLASLELIEVACTPTSAPTSATLRRLTVRVTPLTLPRGGLATTTRNVESRPAPG
jgi:hypothetical protein